MGKTKVSIEDARAWLHRRLTAIPQSGCPEDRAKLKARENEPARGRYPLHNVYFQPDIVNPVKKYQLLVKLRT